MEIKVNTRLKDGKIRTYMVEADTVEEAITAVKTAHPNKPVIALVPKEVNHDIAPEYA